MNLLFRRLGLCLAILLGGSTLFGQIVNIEDRRSFRADTIAWFGNVQLGFNLVDNGDPVYTLNGGINVEYQRMRHLFLSFSRFNLVRVVDQDFVNDGFQHLRYNYTLGPRLTWEAFAQAQYNEKIKLRFRGLIGTGPRWSLLPEASKQRAFLGALYMYEYNEDNVATETNPDALDYLRDHRLSAYLALRFAIGANLVLASTSYFQPVIDNFADQRLSSQTTGQLTITEKLKFTTTFSILYDTRVPEGVPNTTYRWINGIRWNW
ncbi:MAG: DUF481 domain-containing protein [Bacteroidota bacterium]